LKTVESRGKPVNNQGKPFKTSCWTSGFSGQECEEHGAGGREQKAKQVSRGQGAGAVGREEMIAKSEN
jgi:hypothetical protein